eukprot:gnl/MRDRNA2_/MRDRNA2_84484_c2_seq2.p1 gnl/MRDRNA2_/MRDRNA2_84484_c2~~gnl/MRDRNA2_/MRDRNA2_84484_c2_seq2.p1  ORF type:complete len:603 (-),score=98.80 gnl/MRDRNA2_/MRDRNA2_84484_c2_seq2:85-1893(-)
MLRRRTFVVNAPQSANATVIQLYLITSIDLADLDVQVCDDLVVVACCRNEGSCSITLPFMPTDASVSTCWKKSKRRLEITVKDHRRSKVKSTEAGWPSQVELKLDHGRSLCLHCAPPQKSTDSSGYETNMHLWPSVHSLIALLRKIASNPQHHIQRITDQLGLRGPLLKPGDRILELGAGTGAVGLFMAHELGVDVTMTDLPEAMPLLSANVSQNAIKGPANIALEPMCWGTPFCELSPGIQAKVPYQLVVASDCCYDSANLKPLLESIRTLTLPPDSKVLPTGQSDFLGCALLALTDRPGEEESLLEAAASCGVTLQKLCSESLAEESDTIASSTTQGANAAGSLLAQLHGSHTFHLYILVPVVIGKKLIPVETKPEQPPPDMSNVHAQRMKLARASIEAMGLVWPGDHVIEAQLHARLNNEASTRQSRGETESPTQGDLSGGTQGSIQLGLNLSSERGVLLDFQPQYKLEDTEANEVLLHVDIPWLKAASMVTVNMTTDGCGVMLASAAGAPGPPFKLDIPKVGNGKYTISNKMMAEDPKRGCMELQVQFQRVSKPGQKKKISHAHQKDKIHNDLDLVVSCQNAARKPHSVCDADLEELD